MSLAALEVKCAWYLNFLPICLLISLFPVIYFEIRITRAFFDFPRGLELSGLDSTWLNRQAGKMKRALFSHWLPERVRQAHLTRSWFPARTSYLFGHMINPSMTKLGRFLALLSTSPLSWSIKRQKRTWLINIQPSWPHARSITHIFTEEWNKSQKVKSGRMVFVIKNGPHSSPVRFITHTYNLQRKLTIGSFGCLWNCTSRTRVSFSGRSPTESSICLLL